MLHKRNGGCFSWSKTSRGPTDGDVFEMRGMGEAECVLFAKDAGAPTAPKKGSVFPAVALTF